MEEKELYKIKGVEIFSAGTWNGDEYSMADLQEMVNAFNETNKNLKPYLKLGHDPKQKLLQEDGLPAAGWIEKIYTIGDKLVADFHDIPKKIHDLITTKAYRKVSSEIYWNLKVGEKIYKRFLGAVALLGADMPGVMNLSDILSQYKALSDIEPKIYSNTENKLFEIKESSINLKKEGGIMDEVELQEQVKSYKASVAEKEEQLSEKDKEIAELKQYKAKMEEDKLKAQLEIQEARNSAFISELEKENLATPAMKPYLAQLLGEEKKEYSIEIGKDTKKLSKQELIKETLKLFKSIDDVNLDERSLLTEEKAKANEQEKAIEKYVAEHNCKYSQAVKAVLAGHK